MLYINRFKLKNQCFLQSLNLDKFLITIVTLILAKKITLKIVTWLVNIRFCLNFYWLWSYFVNLKSIITCDLSFMSFQRVKTILYWWKLIFWRILTIVRMPPLSLISHLQHFSEFITEIHHHMYKEGIGKE